MPMQNGDVLWMIVAIIQPFKLDDVTLALEALPHFGGMTVSQCRGFGHGKVTREVDLAAPGEDDDAGGFVDFTPKVRLEIAVAGQAQADAVVQAIARSAHTGNRGDGKVFAWHLGRAVRVRTFEEGDLAL